MIKDQWEIMQEWSKNRKIKYSMCISHLKVSINIATEMLSELSKKTQTPEDINDASHDPEKYMDNALCATSFRSISFIKAGLLNFENGGPISVNDALGRMINENILLVRFLIRNRKVIPDWMEFRKLKDFSKLHKDFSKKIRNDYEWFSLKFLMKQLFEDKNLKFTQDQIKLYEKDKTYLDAQIHPSYTGLASDCQNIQNRNDRIMYMFTQDIAEWYEAVSPLFDKYSIDKNKLQSLQEEFIVIRKFSAALCNSFESTSKN